MPDVTDMELVRNYCQQGSEDAFAGLVGRHINLVYSAALRQVGIAAHAEEITQAVFVILARKAGRLRPDTVLEAWLYETTRLTALSFLRGERRRQWREQEAYMQSTLQESTGAAAWTQLAPLLDEAMARLGKKDREAVVLRFFKEKSLGEVAVALQITETAAQSRVHRAVEKLRRSITKRGVALPAAIIIGAISANAVQAAPVTLAKTVTAVAVVKGAAASTSTLTLIQGALKIMAWTKAKTAVATVVITMCVAGGGAGIYAYYSTHSGPAGELRAALHIKKPATGTWAYPSEKVDLAMIHFGSNRANAFPILKKAALSSNPEVQKQAIAALQWVGRPAKPQFGLLGEPSPETVPLLWKILNANDEELSPLALSSLIAIGFQPKDLPVLAALLVRSHHGNDQQLQRYLPEAIAATIQQNPAAATPYIPSVEDLLDDSNADVRFGAACALAQSKGVNDSRISTELAAGLKSRHDDSRPYSGTEGLKQLMAIETLQHIGPDAKSMVPALLEYAKSINDNFMRELALRTAGKIDHNLRNAMPEVDQALKSDPALKNAVPPQ
jgi:RNA polymerase sigma factor (sigma-70 family)